MNKKLIIYYSMDGNTKIIADMMQKETGADSVMLRPAVPYTGTDEEIVSKGKDETNRGFMPELEEIPVNIDDYDTIMIGTPTWWYTMAPVILSFIAHHDLSGKTVIPFQTHAGWPGHALEDIKEAAKGAEVKNGMKIQFSAQEFGKLVTPEKEVEKWMKHYKKKEISVETAGIFLFMF